MNMSQSMEALYLIMNKEFGHLKAKETVSDIIYNIMSDLHDEGLTLTAEELEKRFVERADDFLNPFKDHAA